MSSAQSLKNIDINVYFGGHLYNPEGIDGFPFRGEGIECYYMMLRRKLKTLTDLKRKIMDELKLNPAWYDIKIIYRCPQEVLHERINYGYMAIKEDKHVKMMFNRIQKMPQVNAAELYVSLEASVDNSTEVVQETSTALQFTTLDDGCTTMGGYAMGGYTLSSQDYVANTGGTLYSQETHLEEEDEDEDEDHAANDGENNDDMDQYEERIERGDFENDVDEHEVVPNFEEENMEYHNEGDADDDDIGVQHDTDTTTGYRPPADSFYANTWENMVDPSRLQIPYLCTWQDGMHFCKGLTFANKAAVKRALIIYAAKDNRNFSIQRSSTTELCAACIDDNCKWYVGAYMKPKFNGLWMVTSYVGPHSCIPFGLRRDGRMMDSNFVASEIVGRLRKKHTATVDELWEIIRTKYDHELSYYKVWDAKQKAIAKIFGDWEESYQRLRKLLAYLDQDSGTQYSYHTIPKPLEGTTLLRYVYWAFAPCIAAFQYCRPVISIDGTHLYGKYKGVLMIAMATDANQKVLPIAFAVVDKESGASWGWFLECLRTSIERVIENKDICIISDRHKGIKCAIREWPRGQGGRERVYHRYCLRHVASNFNTHFNNPTLKALALKAGYATCDAKFVSIMQTIKEAEINLLRGVDPTDRRIIRYMPYTYLMSEDVDKWTQSHDGGRRYGAMTTNISECFNGVLKGARGLPIAAMVEFTYFKLVAYFHDRHKQITSDLSRGKVWSDYAMEIYSKNEQKIAGHTLRNYNHAEGIYQVVTPYNDHRAGGGNHSHDVRVFDRTCGCGKWQNLKIPCSHAIKVLKSLHLDAPSYIDPCYSLNNAILTYSHNFVVPKSESLWTDVRGPRWVPDPRLLRAKGRPTMSRIRNEMDGVRRERGSRREDPELREIQPRQRCGVCHQEGHNRRCCPNSHGASTSGSAMN
ncbi:uncharacterized protein LOC115990347 [Quercus lobata]|uniref:uncharacterized protein LOC115964646 n=1 Tax=Quercus lobata TaxID=97700 RepID=UPI00124627BA|nr:uncharacterized protein LOC115964646 [Quercus lobata]XP_030964826.1 uncharacterized protein LOC115986107 [Quercus lobata]XP_030970046.1 uncharacterized protein LOC115990347 [Quercus lobata]